MSIGNIIGANVIDLCLILPVCAMISGGRLPIEFNSLYIDMPFCIGFTLLAILPAVITNTLDNSQRSGVGLTYQTEFNTFRQFFVKLLSNKEKRQQIKMEEDRQVLVMACRI